MSRHSHIRTNYKAEEFVIQPDTEVANWSTANRSYLSPIKPADWNGGVKPPVIIDPGPEVPIDPVPPLSNYDVLKAWFVNSSTNCCYNSPAWGQVPNYDELASL